MKKTTPILCALMFAFFSGVGQNKVYFKDKKISELGINTGDMYGAEEYRPTFPLIWNDFDPNDDDYIFSGFYTLDKNDDNENKILNGPIKLVRFQYCIEEGTINLKEELTYNFTNGNMNGPVNYVQYSSECNGETNESELKNATWKKDVSISANYDYEDYKYKNISFFETREWEKSKYSISQGAGYDISLEYFNTIININTSTPNEKPIFKKIKY